MKKIVIIGNGIAGITAARHIRKFSNHQITVISAESKYFFSRTALMYVYMGHMKWDHLKPYENDFWAKNNIELIQDVVVEVLPEKKQLKLKDNYLLGFDQLVVATGSKPNKFGWPGQNLSGVCGLYFKQDLEALEHFAPNNKVCQRAVIVGGGLIGIELAEMLRSRDIPVTMLVRETHFWNNVLPDEEASMLYNHIKSHHIDLRLKSNLDSIIDDGNGKVKAVKVKETGEIINCNYVGLTPGVSPNVSFLKDSGIRINKGIVVNDYLETNHKDIYAIGDCAEQEESKGNRPPIEAVWYTGRMMGEVVAQTICENKTAYKPGNWFNSAKFLDIEYQTYGWVFNQPKHGDDDFYWKHPHENICIHIHYEKSSRKFKGINAFGIRLRHEVMDRWLNESKSVDHVINNFSQANFDPEFYKDHTQQIQHSFQKHQNKKAV
jgi:NAD(P)H-nitrite reductase large subunit